MATRESTSPPSTIDSSTNEMAALLPPLVALSACHKHWTIPEVFQPVFWRFTCRDASLQEISEREEWPMQLEEHAFGQQKLEPESRVCPDPERL
jgi:hypothetical protein